MKNGCASLIFLLTINFGFCQAGFMFPFGVDKVEIAFDLEKNLILIPVELNGVQMRFLLDTGVAETILFSLDDKSEVTLLNVEKIKMRGLGEQDAVEGLKSSGNILKINGLVKKNEDVVVVLDESFNFSSSLGVAVNGIIGTSFFEKNFVEINYRSKKITVHKTLKTLKSLKKYTEISLSIEEKKPYFEVEVAIDDRLQPSKLLLDTGSSDALWIFRTKENKFEIPQKHFDDFLGRGFSGDILGQRAVVNKIKIKNFEFEKAIVAFPDTLAVQKMNLVAQRAGSIGSEILSRFKIVFDYQNEKIYLKKNYRFGAIFSYNKSGIEIQHAGLRLVQEAESTRITSNVDGGVKINFSGDEQNVKYKFELKPNFEVVNIRKGSPSENAGLKVGDLILMINGVKSYRYKLQEIADILKSDDGKIIKLEIERSGKNMKITFKLADML